MICGEHPYRTTKKESQSEQRVSKEHTPKKKLNKNETAKLKSLMQLAQSVLGVTIRGDSEHQGEGGLVSGHLWVNRV